VELWTVYDHPPDHPDAFVVRRILVGDEGLLPADSQVFHTVHEARSTLAERGLTRIPRGPGDDPALVETWL